MSIQDKIVPAQPDSNVINLAKISVQNYLGHLQDQQNGEVLPNAHKKIMEIKKNINRFVGIEKYHQLVKELYPLLD